MGSFASEVAAGPVLYTVFLWWFSTGVILYLDGLARWTHKWTMMASTLLLLLALLGLAVTADDTRVTGAYLAFTCALLVWGWQEVAFLLGYVTGSRRSPCPPHARGWRRAWYAFQAIWHHEFALVVLGVAVVAATRGGDNQTGVWTFAVLWIMRLSAKLNVFLGVRNLSEHFLPEHLAYLQTYFRRRGANGLWPFSVAGASAAAFLIWREAAGRVDEPAAAAALSFAATLLTLAILEHVFLLLPLPTDRLWSWGLRSRAPTGGAMIGSFRPSRGRSDKDSPGDRFATETPRSRRAVGLGP